MTVLAVPPLLPAIHHDLGLDEKLVGALTGLPVLLLAVGSVFGSLLVARLGARRALISGLCLLGVAGAARGLGPNTALLFVMTIAMGVGIAVSQPALPSLVRAWLPDRTGLATAVFSNGFLVGEILAAALTGAVVLPLVAHHWEPALALWSIPVLVTAAIVAFGSAHRPKEPSARRHAWWPDWRGGLTWRLGLVFGGASAAYFGSNAFIPDYLKATHHAALIPAALTSLNLSQLPASVVAGLIPRRVIARRWPLIAAGAVTGVSALGFGLGGIWVVAWAATMGLASASIFVLTLALPPLLAGIEDVHRLTAGILTITYSCPFVASLLGGAAWDASGMPVMPFLPVAGAGVMIVAISWRLDLSAARASMSVPL
ncbi:MAG TPA: MFS transporter [Chloroflexota bacterium]|nr:MFS transporter [Chloroflexota bacterium]